MSNQIVCSCGTTLAVRPELAGKQVRCPKCDAVLKVPETSGNSATATTLRCPCGQTLKAPSGAAGKQVRCPKCDKVLRVPGESPQATTPTAGTTAARTPAAPGPNLDFSNLPSSFPAGGQPQANPFVDANVPKMPKGAAKFPTAAASAKQNPYQPTLSTGDTSSGGTYETLRRKHLRQETSIRTIGLLHMFGGVMAMLGATLFTISSVFAIFQGDEGAVLVTLFGVAYGAFGFGSFYTGRGLRRFENTPRTLAIIISVIGLLAIPFGTLINALFLYVLCNRNASVIFSDRYREAVKQTPHVKNRFSFGFVLLVAVLISILIVGVIFVIATVAGA
ncbi:MAG: hypothetical protein AAF802_11110 [Planctomycetota bacterium]